MLQLIVVAVAILCVVVILSTIGPACAGSQSEGVVVVLWRVFPLPLT